MCELCVNEVKKWILQGDVNKLMEYINTVKEEE